VSRPDPQLFQGLGPLIRFTARRDRLRLGLWLGGIVALLVGSAASLLGVYPDQESIDTYVRLFGDNPALVAFAGPGYGFDDPTIGVILVNETQVFACIATALMSIFLVNRHTRVEEDAERAELVRAGVVGRHAPATASAVVVAAMNVAVAVLAAVGFVALGYATVGSLALAGSILVVGLVFAGVAAVAAQVGGTSRSALGLGLVVLAVAFLVRAVGDVGGSWVSWASPIGWAQGVRAFAGERWWTLGLCALLAVALTLASFRLASRRDLGAGLVPPRPGRARAGRWARSPLGLAVRLQRGAVVGWATGLFVAGIVYGSIGDDVAELVEDNPTFADVFVQLGGGSLVDSYLGTAMAMLALVAAGFSVSSALALRSEETAGRAEPLLAGPLERWRWALGHLAVAAFGSVVVLAAAGLGVGVAYAAVSGDAGEVVRNLGAALVTLPAVLVLVGLAALLVGVAPRAALAVWGALALMAVIGFLGRLLRLPDWVMELSPLEHVPRLPAEDLALTPLLVLLVLSVALVAAGLGGLRARDLHIR